MDIMDTWKVKLKNSCSFSELLSQNYAYFNVGLGTIDEDEGRGNRGVEKTT